MHGELEIDPELLAQGIKDTMAGKGTLMTEEEVQETMMAFQKEVMGKQEELRKVQAGENLEKGKEFMANNAMGRGVKTTSSGLQYKIIEKGTGKSPTLDDTVTVNYKGTLIDGTEFDSSYKRGEPATFPVKGVIPGWTEVLQLMKEERQLVLAKSILWKRWLWHGVVPTARTRSTWVRAE